MTTETRKYARGTELVVRYPWGTFVGGRALCTDGKVRALARIAQTADTFFSIPASVKVNGHTVSGFVTFRGEHDDEGMHVAFVAYAYGKNGHLLASDEEATMPRAAFTGAIPTSTEGDES